jgi:hypothetical protein
MSAFFLPPMSWWVRVLVALTDRMPPRRATAISRWHGAQLAACYEVDENRHRVETSRFDAIDQLRCTHYRDDELGDLFFTRG